MTVEILEIVLAWVKRQSAPNYRFAYSRCIICDCTWWGDKERHELSCWVPLLKQEVEKRRTKDQMQSEVKE